jgi:hypothetical protein
MTTHRGPVTVNVLCPNVANNDALNGQNVPIIVESSLQKIKVLKEYLANELNIGINKIKLSRSEVGPLTDAFSLAHYNIDSETQIQLLIKGRGGKKKS